MHDEEEGVEEENFALYKRRLPQADEILLCRANLIPEPPQVIKYLFLLLIRSEGKSDIQSFMLHDMKCYLRNRLS